MLGHGDKGAGVFDFLEKIGDKIFTEAGLVAFLLFWGLIYVAIQLRGERKENRLLNQKMYDMGIKQTVTNSETNSLLDKISDAFKAMADKLHHKCERKCHENNGNDEGSPKT